MGGGRENKRDNYRKSGERYGGEKKGNRARKRAGQAGH